MINLITNCKNQFVNLGVMEWIIFNKLTNATSLRSVIIINKEQIIHLRMKEWQMRWIIRGKRGLIGISNPRARNPGLENRVQADFHNESSLLLGSHLSPKGPPIQVRITMQKKYTYHIKLLHRSSTSLFNEMYVTEINNLYKIISQTTEQQLSKTVTP